MLQALKERQFDLNSFSMEHLAHFESLDDLDSVLLSSDLVIGYFDL